MDEVDVISIDVSCLVEVVMVEVLDWVLDMMEIVVVEV